MPRPPPPESALITIGPPWAVAKARISSTLLGPSVAGSTGTPAAVAARRADDLLPNRSSAAASGPTNVIPRARARPGKLGLFAEKPVAGMNQFGAGILGRRQNRRVVQVGGRSGAGQSDRFVGRVNVRAVGIVLGVHSDRAELQLGCGADDSERDLTAVSDQQARHVRPSSRSLLSSRSHHPLLHSGTTASVSNDLPSYAATVPRIHLYFVAGHFLHVDHHQETRLYMPLYYVPSLSHRFDHTT